MEDKKQRISLFLDKDFVVKMDKEIKSAGFKSRNDFVAYAVNSYLQTSFCRMKILLSMKSSQRKLQRLARNSRKEFQKGCSDMQLSLS